MHGPQGEGPHRPSGCYRRPSGINVARETHRMSSHCVRGGRTRGDRDEVGRGPSLRARHPAHHTRVRHDGQGPPHDRGDAGAGPGRRGHEGEAHPPYDRR
eukprot:285183_1